MSVQLLAFLGTGKYETVRYRMAEGFEHETAFCPVAVAKACAAQRFKVLATQEAVDTHGEALRQACIEAEISKPEIIRIPSGQDELELRELFETLRCAATESSVETLVIDITHGFRAQPFFAGALVQYLQSLYPATAVRLVYGAFEARDPDTRFTAVWELTWYAELAALNAALRVFLDTGHAQALTQLLERVGGELNRQWAAQGRSGEQPALQKLAKSLREFGEAIDAVRIGALLLPQTPTRPSLAGTLLGSIETAQTAYDHLPLIQEPLDRLAERIRPLVADVAHLGGPDAQPMLAALARLYLDWGRLPEAAIVLREA